MAIKLHQAGYVHAIAIIKNGLEVEHASDWNACRPDKNEEARYLETHNLSEYGSWFLGIASDLENEGKAQFKYPFGDFNLLHVSALQDIIQESGKENHADIQAAAEKLLAMIQK